MTGQALQQYLNNILMSKEEFAKIVGVTPPAVQHWVFGRREIPLYVVKLIDYFEEDLRDFAMEEG